MGVMAGGGEEAIGRGSGKKKRNIYINGDSIVLRTLYSGVCFYILRVFIYENYLFNFLSSIYLLAISNLRKSKDT